MTSEQRIKNAMDIIESYGGFDGEHHKAWVIDQVARALTEDQYPEFVKRVKNGIEGPDTYSWDEGISP